MPFKPHHLTINILLLLLLASSSLAIQAEDGSTDFFEQQKLTSRLLTDMLLEKIDASGGLELFGQTITREDLISHQVAYIHNLADDSLQICVRFLIAEELVVPDYEDFLVKQVSIVVDQEGNILEVNAHVTAREEPPTPEQ